MISNSGKSPWFIGVSLEEIADIFYCLSTISDTLRSEGYFEYLPKPLPPRINNLITGTVKVKFDFPTFQKGGMCMEKDIKEFEVRYMWEELHEIEKILFKFWTSSIR